MSNVSPKPPAASPPEGSPAAWGGPARPDLILNARNLHKRFHEGPLDVTVLRGVDVQVQAGETLAIVGASGSGKSTLLHLHVAPIRPTTWHLQEHGRAFPPNHLHESWHDWLYWDVELQP